MDASFICGSGLNFGKLALSSLPRVPQYTGAHSKPSSLTTTRRFSKNRFNRHGRSGQALGNDRNVVPAPCAVFVQLTSVAIRIVKLETHSD